MDILTAKIDRRRFANVAIMRFTLYTLAGMAFA